MPIMGKWHLCARFFERIIINVAFKQDRHKNLKKFRGFHAQEDCLITVELQGPEKTAFCISFQNVFMVEFVGSQVRDRCL